jgi:hypothetical protein
MSRLAGRDCSAWFPTMMSRNDGHALGEELLACE